MTLSPLNSDLFQSPHQWIVYRLADGRIRAAMIKNQDDLKYFKARPDIVASTFLTAFNRSEAWHKGKNAVQS